MHFDSTRSCIYYQDRDYGRSSEWGYLRGRHKGARKRVCDILSLELAPAERWTG